MNVRHFCPCLKDLLTRVADADLQIKRVGGGGAGGVFGLEENFFSAPWASVWSKILEGAAPWAPPLDPPLGATF